MAGVVDVLLKIVGDSRDAVQSVNQVGDAAERSTGRVSRLSETLSTLAVRAGAIGAAAVGIVEGFQQAAAQADQALGLDRPTGELRGATSAADAARILQQRGNFRFGDLFAWGNFGRVLSAPFGTGELDYHRRERVEADIRAAALTDPEGLRASLAYLSPSRADYAREQLARANQAGVYQAQLKAAAAATTVNVYTGVGDRNAVGREVRAALDARDRNNGRYVQTNTRR